MKLIVNYELKLNASACLIGIWNSTTHFTEHRFRSRKLFRSIFSYACMQ